MTSWDSYINNRASVRCCMNNDDIRSSVVNNTISLNVELPNHHHHHHHHHHHYTKNQSDCKTLLKKTIFVRQTLFVTMQSCCATVEIAFTNGLPYIHSTSPEYPATKQSCCTIVEIAFTNGLPYILHSTSPEYPASPRSSRYKAGCRKN